MRLLALAACAALAAGATLSNLRLPVDEAGDELVTGEASVLLHAGRYYFYFNDWGGCPGIDCCGSSGGCASCCFGPEQNASLDGCVYRANHSVVAYSTADLASWRRHGVVLAEAARAPGVEFRPNVIRHAASGAFLMWYEDRHENQTGYAVAVADGPAGPFRTVVDDAAMQGRGRVGDFSLFVDDDGAAYHVRTGFVVERLADDYRSGAGPYAEFASPEPAEAPVMFKERGTYYVVAGTGCCACRGGASAYVFSADAPLGNWTYRGDVGSRPGAFDPHSPDNYVTNAQGSAVFRVGGDLVYLGNQWVTSARPGGPRNNDLLSWYKLEFDSDGDVAPLTHIDAIDVRPGGANLEGRARAQR